MASKKCRLSLQTWEIDQLLNMMNENQMISPVAQATVQQREDNALITWQPGLCPLMLLIHASILNLSLKTFSPIKNPCL